MRLKGRNEEIKEGEELERGGIEEEKSEPEVVGESSIREGGGEKSGIGGVDTQDKTRREIRDGTQRKWTKEGSQDYEQSWKVQE